MNSKLIVTGAGAFGLGALLSWAMTADHFERKTKVLEKGLIEQHELINSYIWQLKGLPETPMDTEEQLGWVPPTEEAVQMASDKTSSDILANEDSEEAGVETDLEKSPEGSADESEVNEEELEKARTNLQDLISSYAADPDAVEEFTSMAGNALEYDGSPPFVIPVSLYASDPDEGDNYEKVTLKYFPRTRILIDDDEDPIEDVANYVGWRNLNHFGDESGDADVVFIRNRRLMTDYEVVKEDDTDPPIHVTYGMSRAEFETNKAAGVIKFREEDSD